MLFFKEFVEQWEKTQYAGLTTFTHIDLLAQRKKKKEEKKKEKREHNTSD